MTWGVAKNWVFVYQVQFKENTPHRDSDYAVGSPKTQFLSLDQLKKNPPLPNSDYNIGRPKTEQDLLIFSLPSLSQIMTWEDQKLSFS